MTDQNIKTGFQYFRICSVLSSCFHCEDMAEAMLKFFDHEHLSQAVEYDEEDGRPGSMDNSQFNENNLSLCEDVVINQSFPRQPADSKLAKFIEYRVKLLSLRKVLLQDQMQDYG